MKKLEPMEADHSKLKANFAGLRNQPLAAKSAFGCEIISQPSYICCLNANSLLVIHQLDDSLVVEQGCRAPCQDGDFQAMIGFLLLDPLTFVSYLLRAIVLQVEEMTYIIKRAFMRFSYPFWNDPNLYRSMRDRMHPPRMSAPSCIIPPTEQLIIRPHIVPLLPTFHGMESENPYAHIKEFEDVCNTFQEGGTAIELMRLKLFPFTLKDKAKIWLNSLRPRSIRTWTELQADFLKKFFPTHRTNGLKRQSPTSQHILETMCGGDFMSKNPEEAMDFLSYVSEVSRGWDEPTNREIGKRPVQQMSKGGMYNLSEDMEMKAKVAAMARKIEEMELRKVHEVQAISEPQQPANPCSICQSFEHMVEECPTIPAVREMFGEQANLIGQWKPNSNAPYGNTYNSSWRNHPNFAWKPRPNPYQSPAQSSQQSQGQSSVEQALVSLSKVMGDFVSEQKSINSQLNQKIDNVESTLNKKIDGMYNELSQKIDNIQYSISRLTNLNTVNEKGKFPSQPHQNPKGIHEVESKDEDSSKVRDVQAIITLRSGKEVHQPEHDQRKAKEDRLIEMKKRRMNEKERKFR
ncbi:hypothetical protein CK203_090877 [Vitis vinifera]|uniref:Retrotransposon gag domain-containing protein n=1 Tax=Vitis vinifera TaxID=29760 RepID=A0A438CMT2_VITVI|nr:hypothetical protein CK203_090877 [Vitis vinifera]